MKKTIRMLVCMILAAAMLTVSVLAFAEQEQPEQTKYRLGEVVNAGKDTGYSETNDIDLNDPHFTWKLGDFFITGFTQKAEDKYGNPVFLKNVGDRIALRFDLQQDIDYLNGNEKLSISNDKNGYDEYFDVDQTDIGFGRGALIVRFTDYQNCVHEPVVYTDFLPEHADKDDTLVELFEEGDYEVALDYEIKNKKTIFPTYTNYRIFFKFSVRNGNCMVFPKDLKTGNELTNTSIAENGFYLDLAKSRYLTINIRREILTEGADGVMEDVRFNRPAKDHDPFRAEGIYTITVTNQYTGQHTVKIIYVGTNRVLKAYVNTGLSISEINRKLAAGAYITNDGVIILPANTAAPGETAVPLETEAPQEEDLTEKPQEEVPTAAPEIQEPEQNKDKKLIRILETVIAVLAIIIVILIISLLVKRKNKKAVSESDNSKKEEGETK